MCWEQTSGREEQNKVGEYRVCSGSSRYTEGMENNQVEITDSNQSTEGTECHSDFDFSQKRLLWMVCATRVTWPDVF